MVDIMTVYIEESEIHDIDVLAQAITHLSARLSVIAGIIIDKTRCRREILRCDRCPTTYTMSSLTPRGRCRLRCGVLWAAKPSSFRNDRVHLCPAVKTVR
jgi:hypothetical protein